MQILLGLHGNVLFMGSNRIFEQSFLRYFSRFLRCCVPGHSCEVHGYFACCVVEVNNTYFMLPPSILTVPSYSYFSLSTMMTSH